MSLILVRAILQTDFAAWKPLWDGYNAFYGRHGVTALAPAITQATWQRFFDPAEPVFALVAELDGQLLGLTHAICRRISCPEYRACFALHITLVLTTCSEILITRKADTLRLKQ